MNIKIVKKGIYPVTHTTFPESDYPIISKLEDYEQIMTEDKFYTVYLPEQLKYDALVYVETDYGFVKTAYRWHEHLLLRRIYQYVTPEERVESLFEGIIEDLASRFIGRAG